MEFSFPFNPSPEVPRDFVYRRAIPADVCVAAQNARLAEAFMGADSVQETLLYLKPNEVVQLADVWVVFTELEGDYAWEWRVELRTNRVRDVEAQKMHLAHGYMPAGILMQQGVDRKAVAKEIATKALTEQTMVT